MTTSFNSNNRSTDSMESCASCALLARQTRARAANIILFIRQLISVICLTPQNYEELRISPNFWDKRRKNVMNGTIRAASILATENHDW